MSCSTELQPAAHMSERDAFERHLRLLALHEPGVDDVDFVNEERLHVVPCEWATDNL